MIGRLAGILAQKQPPQVLVDVQGVGYEIDVPMSTFYQLPAVGERIVLHTQLVVREDAQQLFGFLTEAERSTFRQLLKVAGVGARTALAVLSGLSVPELTEAVARQETGRLTKIPGIGKKTAERLLLELKDKMGSGIVLGAVGPRSEPVSSDVLHALLALGYNEREALAAMKTVADGVGVAEGIKQALKALSKA
ncbi:MAG TPA: Holliday junction branch migration protein RuvA [Burkholderiales bacterium]|nr:Holliday junction branch migration protein RuvA [Betaproteobacteria bacterium]HQR53312.1 Holliday junction branch migration protein RuvA [Burkholderiales bacterium]